MFELISVKHIDAGNFKGINVYVVSYRIFHACYRYNNDNIHICGLECNKNFRRLGICSHVIDIIKNKAKKENIKTITLDVDKKNLIAQKCYKKNGFIFADENNLMIYYL